MFDTSTKLSPLDSLFLESLIRKLLPTKSLYFKSHYNTMSRKTYQKPSHGLLLFHCLSVSYKGPNDCLKIFHQLQLVSQSLFLAATVYYCVNRALRIFAPFRMLLWEKSPVLVISIDESNIQNNYPVLFELNFRLRWPLEFSWPIHRSEGTINFHLISHNFVQCMNSCRETMFRLWLDRKRSSPKTNRFFSI